MIRLGSRLLGLLVAVVCLSACAVAPPVQQMSDARQAIAAAVQAGAADAAPQRLQEARGYLATAEAQIRRHAYGSARINAERAKGRAVHALETSRAATAQGTHAERD